MASNIRKKVGIGAALAAGLMATASASSACTVYRGDMTFTNASGSQTMHAQNTVAMDMAWCGGAPPFTLSTAAATTATVHVSSAVQSNPACDASFLSNDTYNVSVKQGFMGQSAQPHHINCHGVGGAKTIGQYVVTGGAGAGTEQAGGYNYTASSRGIGWDNICVWGTAVGNSSANDTNIAAV